MREKEEISKKAVLLGVCPCCKIECSIYEIDCGMVMSNHCDFRGDSICEGSGKHPLRIISRVVRED